MSYKITDNTARVVSDTDVKTNIFLRLIADEIDKTARPNTPKKTGRLRADVVKQVLGNRAKIVWGKRYAIFQETKQYRNYTTPGTGPKFAEKAVKKVVSSFEGIARKAGLL